MPDVVATLAIMRRRQRLLISCEIPLISALLFVRVPRLPSLSPRAFSLWPRSWERPFRPSPRILTPLTFALLFM